MDDAAAWPGWASETLKRCGGAETVEGKTAANCKQLKTTARLQDDRLYLALRLLLFFFFFFFFDVAFFLKLKVEVE